MEVGLITENIGIIKLVVDLSIALCLVVGALAWLRRGSASRAVNKLAELESSIRQLINEAEQAAQRVQEDLAIRRQDIESLLEKARDVESPLRVGVDREPAEVAEQGTRTTPKNGKDSKHPRRPRSGSIDKEQQASRSSAATLSSPHNNSSTISDGPSSHISPPITTAAAAIPAAPLNHVNSPTPLSFGGDVGSSSFADLWQQEPVAPSFREAMRPVARHLNLSSHPKEKESVSATPLTAATPKINEEQLQLLSSLARNVTASLGGQVEKIIGPSSSGTKVEEPSGDKLSEVISKADEMLMSGVDIRTVSRLTGLPLEQVEFLHAVILDEQMAVSRDDPRLGVLAGV